eukprot:CAMPEP_0184016560 /NCGR_PEP_ID=MMETSP0954-20121128/6998_1 /TAXON_ID=627963 /ORGANISM="Aplanochytrium sp, Strain PBS07" /LENGTH=492 /DNA_ID=CAMNT_0026297597 /DNA_START=318 /DNA_END=1797 /DNA_ORIENTATION=-
MFAKSAAFSFVLAFYALTVSADPLHDLYDNVRAQFGGTGPDAVLPELTEENKRELQNSNEVKLCATGFNNGGKTNHVLVNVNKANKPTLQWLPKDPAYFCVTIKKDRKEIKLEGTVVPRERKYNEAPLYVEVTFKNKKEWDQCYCASADFVGGNPLNPSYKRVQKDCTWENFMNRPDDDSGLYYCPKCENWECHRARDMEDKTGAPSPVYAGWDFYTEVDGRLWGPGACLFLEENQRNFPEIEEVGTECIISNQNIPLAQFGCSDDELEDPVNGYGYGVTTKNQACGFATWFTCENELTYIGGNDISVHTADFNFNVVPCPAPPPTLPPSELCPKTPNACKKYNNEDEDNYCSTEEQCEKDGGVWVSPWKEDGGISCPNSGDNDKSCGCCTFPPPPTPFPTNAPTIKCPNTPSSCRNFNNEDGDNFCSSQEVCEEMEGWYWDTEAKEEDVKIVAATKKIVAAAESNTFANIFKLKKNVLKKVAPIALQHVVP